VYSNLHSGHFMAGQTLTQAEKNAFTQAMNQAITNAGRRPNVHTDLTNVFLLGN